MRRLQARARRAVADDDQPQRRAGGARGARRRAARARRSSRPRRGRPSAAPAPSPAPPARAQRGAALRRGEAAGVDAAADDRAGSWKPALAELARASPASARRCARVQVVEAAQQAAAPARRAAEAVVAAVLVEVGAEVGGRRRCRARAPRASAAQASGPGVARWTSSGAAALEARVHSGPTRARPKRRSRVHRNRAAGGAQLVAGVERRDSPGWRGRISSTWWPRSRRKRDGPLDGQRDAVQLGRVGFGDVGDAHGRRGRRPAAIVAIAVPGATSDWAACRIARAATRRSRRDAGDARRRSSPSR